MANGEKAKEPLAYVVDLFKHWDSGYWTAVNVFVLTQAALLAGLAAAAKDENPTATALRGVIPVVGAVIVVLWMFVLGRKRAFIEGAEKTIGAELGDLYP